MTNIKEALRIARGYIADDVTRKPSEYDPRADLRAIDAALAQLDSADAVSSTTLARDWKTIEEQIVSATPTELFSLFRDYLVMNSTPGDDLAPLYIARITAILSTGLLPDASPGNGAEKMDSLMDSQYLAGAKAGWNAAHTDDPDASFQRIVDGRKDHLKGLRTFNEALQSTSAAGETTSSDGAESQREVQAQMGPAKTKASPSALGAGDRPSEAIPVDVREESSKQYRDAVDQVNRSTDRDIADVLAMKEACKRAVSECLNQYGRMTFVTEKGWSGLEGQILAAIDKLSPEGKALPDWKQDQAETMRIKPPATAEGGRDEPVAWMRHKVDGDGPTHCNEDDDGAFPVYVASPPDVEAIRADERERCAAEVERRNWPTVGDARRIASAIRTGGQK